MTDIAAVSNVQASLESLLRIEGAMAAALVDSGSGMLLGGVGSGLDLDVAAAGNTEVVRAKLRTAKALGLGDAIDDILITLTTQFHIIRPMAKTPEVFIYLVLDRDRSNLAMARIKTKEVEGQLAL
ncbi:hypothetical protein GCM10027515_32640 [Schumannella luteola]|uniref:Roadblock/LC7 domain-containing protein n=1 Tax=Schumannella luteola TaxID=472059 RepID=A0A852Y7K1_9MICO|nr:hypothetical protein [Schumannella luteola]NYG98936.1 hypothetical protein [Schumannella luteola]TPX06310.1 hypothetical protein FJ656_01325 [Schumannella luteola]